MSDKNSYAVFVGTDRRMQIAEKALAESILCNCPGEIDIHEMRAGDYGWSTEWNRGRPQGKPYSGVGWATDFTNFRFAVPYLVDSEAYDRLIYVDVDMIVLGDLQELADMDLHEKACATLKSGRMEVMVFDPSHYYWETWHGLNGLKKTKASISELRHQIKTDGVLLQAIDDRVWNVKDTIYDQAKLVHFTNMRTQPWKPWPDYFSYPTHKSPEACEAFWAFVHAAERRERGEE